MSEYKKILSGYLNTNKNGNGKYLTITNVSDEPIVIEPGKKLFMNMTSKEIRDKYPKVPLFSKSIKVEDRQPLPIEVDPNDVPF